MTRHSYLKNGSEIQAVPPSPELEKRILRTKRRFLTGGSLPRKATLDLLDLQSFIQIYRRPAYTRPHTLGASAVLPSPAVGERRALVLLVDFQDNQAKKSREHYADMLFSSGKYPTGSLRDYYYECSYYKLAITGDVDGGDSGWYRAPRPYSYYAGDKYGFGEYPGNATRLVEDVVDLAAEHVNFADYDMDGDGEVDAIFIVHAGQGAEATGRTNHIWSHMSNIPPKIVDGVRVNRYSMEPEDGNIGVFCHELGHVFGLPDLYDYDMDSAGTGSWDLMAGGSWNNNGMTPAHPVGWSKAKLGWIDTQIAQGPMEGITKDITDITIRPSSLYPDIYRIPAGPAGTDEKQYFLIENRKKTGFDSYIPGEGLMVLHIDENQKNNNDQEHYLVDIEQCDGRLDLNRNANRGDEDDLFPIGHKDAFSADTYPSSRMYGGNDSGVALKNIRRKGEDIVLDISAGAVHTGAVHAGAVHADAVSVADVPAAAVSTATRYCSREPTMTLAHRGSRWAWAYVSDLGWQRIKEEWM